MYNRLQKHVGVDKITGSRVIVVYRELPEDKSKCVVIEIDRIPDLLQVSIGECLASAKARDTNDLFEVLHTWPLSDGSMALITLHTRGYMSSMNVDQIDMTPFPNQKVPLSIVNSELNGTLKKDDIIGGELIKEEAKVDNSPQGQLARADILEAEAQLMRTKVYSEFPELKPVNAKPRAKAKPKHKEKV